MKAIIKKVAEKARAAWEKLPARTQSAIRHLVTTFAVTFAVTAKPLLDGIWVAPDLKTGAALASAAVIAAGTAAVRVCVPLALIYAKALVAWALSKLLA
jgi:hypothetical protein